MINRPLLKVVINLSIILTHMPRIPPITASSVLSSFTQWERRRRAFQRHVPRAHNCLPDVFEAVVDVPGHFDRLDVG